MSIPPLLRSRDFPMRWKIDLQDYDVVDKYLETLIAEDITFQNYRAKVTAPSNCLNALISRVRDLLTDKDCGVALIDLRHSLKGKPELIDRAKLLIVGMERGLVRQLREITSAILCSSRSIEERKAKVRSTLVTP